MDPCYFDWDFPGEFEERDYYFWVRTVVDALDLIGPETDSNLERMCRLLLEYAQSVEASPEAIEQIPLEIVQIRGGFYSRDNSPISRKYRCIRSLAHSRGKNHEDPAFWWAYALHSAFDLINFNNDNEQAFNALICRNAAKYGVDFDGEGD